MLLSCTVNCSFLGADSHPFHLFLLKQTFKDTFGVLALSATVGQPETSNGVLLQRQKRVLQFTHFSDGLSCSSVLGTTLGKGWKDPELKIS